MSPLALISRDNPFPVWDSGFESFGLPIQISYVYCSSSVAELADTHHFAL